MTRKSKAPAGCRGDAMSPIRGLAGIVKDEMNYFKGGKDGS